MSTTFYCSFTKKKQGPQADFFDESFAWKSFVLAAVSAARMYIVEWCAIEQVKMKVRVWTRKKYTTHSRHQWVAVQLDILFSSNHNIHKSSYGLCFWASDPFIDTFYYNLSIKGSEAQNQRPHELL